MARTAYSLRSCLTKIAGVIGRILLLTKFFRKYKENWIMRLAWDASRD